MQKKTPARMCLGCKEMKPKRELIRVVRSPEGAVSIDLNGKSPGRGAYLCRDAACLRRAVKSRALARALGVEIPAEIQEELAARIAPTDGTYGQ